MIQVVLDFPPSANAIWRTSKGKTHLSEKYRSWRRVASWMVMAAMSKAHKPPIEGQYFLAIEAARPDKRKRDLDNIIKPISDALVAGGAVADDSNAARIHAHWSDDVDLKGVRVNVCADFGDDI